VSGPSSANAARGAYGEDRAASWYRERGYSIIERNWRSRHGEIDLIAGRGELVVFVEVKARASERFGSPFEAITAAKQRRIHRLAYEWLAQHDVHGVRLRFDAVAVLGAEVSVIEDAF
jgi:putative endonuclease